MLHLEPIPHPMMQTIPWESTNLSVRSFILIVDLLTQPFHRVSRIPYISHLFGADSQDTGCCRGPDENINATVCKTTGGLDQKTTPAIDIRCQHGPRNSHYMALPSRCN